LIDGITKITSVLRSREGKKLRSVDVLDICNIIGSIVVSGNVRRSAQIAVGDSDDVLFLRAKRWDLGIPNWRAFSNNTISADSADYLLDEFWNGYTGNGEPYGIFNERLSQTYGRLGEVIPDKCELPNPCSEQILESYESCNLAEVFLPNIETLDQFIDVTQLLYKTCKAITRMDYLHEESNEVIHRNSRIGIGTTGICEAMDKVENWSDIVYRELRAFDAEWSAELGINSSIKLSTNKPSGTLSLLAGVTPGVHPAFAPFYIRRVRMSSDDTLIQYCKNKGYAVEFARNFDGTTDYNTSIVSFPCRSSDNAILARDMTAIAQLELVKKMQTIWSDSAVSCTVYYKKEELPEIKAWLAENYEHSIKAVSFLLHNEHGFDQAPYEEISAATYHELRSNLKQSSTVSMSSLSELSDDECATGACPIR
jgi:adenosylcobalamin-dependent ribonucleoside-triphosphate reductase